MLLSPQLGAGGAVAEGLRIVIRSEDLLLLVVAFSWLAKTAVNKELGLTLKTSLNRPILAYVAATAIATLIGYMTGTVAGWGGAFYVLKYIEYFVVYYMVVNNLVDRRQAWRLVTAAFLTAVIVSLIGLTQIPSGQRVSAPFEGKEGEPNTFGGYLLLLIAVAGGIALETARIRTRAIYLGLAGLMSIPFMFTLSRTSYVGAIPALATMAVLSSRRLTVPEERGLALGFVAGTAGLLGHALGANTFIIVRIMEPFWFFAAVVVALPGLAPAETAAAAPAPAVRLTRRLA